MCVAAQNERVRTNNFGCRCTHIARLCCTLNVTQCCRAPLIVSIILFKAKMEEQARCIFSENAAERRQKPLCCSSCRLLKLIAALSPRKKSRARFYHHLIFCIVLCVKAKRESLFESVFLKRMVDRERDDEGLVATTCTNSHGSGSPCRLPSFSQRNFIMQTRLMPTSF